MKELTVIKVTKQTKAKLAKRKVHPRETYEDVIKRLLMQTEKPAKA